MSSGCRTRMPSIRDMGATRVRYDPEGQGYGCPVRSQAPLAACTPRPWPLHAGRRQGAYRHCSLPRECRGGKKRRLPRAHRVHGHLTPAGGRERIGIVLSPPRMPGREDLPAALSPTGAQAAGSSRGTKFSCRRTGTSPQTDPRIRAARAVRRSAARSRSWIAPGRPARIRRHSPLPAGCGAGASARCGGSSASVRGRGAAGRVRRSRS